MLNEIIVKPLRLIAKRIFSGASLYSIEKLIGSKEGVPVLNIKDIMENQIITDNLSLFSLEDFKNRERYMVYSGDVLLTCRGTQFKIAVVPENLKQAIITANLIAVRLTNGMLPMFLATYLKTKEAQRLLLAKTSSSRIQLVLNVSDVGEMDIPVPPLSLQEKIVNLANVAEEQYRLNIESANLIKRITNQIVINMLIK